MPAIIGITSGLRPVRTDAGLVPGHAVLPTYTTMVRAAGAVPVLLTPVAPEAIPALLDRLDAVILSGGGDVDPGRYGGTPHPSIYGVDPNRDDFELALSCMAAERRVPTLCICRGMQVMNVALGGTLIEDIGTRIPGAIDHFVGGEAASEPRHSVEVAPGSTTAKVLGATTIEVNSIHHQAVDQIAGSLVATGHSPDGVVEALEPADDAWPMWAVQWHPEYLGPGHPESLRLFETLVAAAGG